MPRVIAKSLQVIAAVLFLLPGMVTADAQNLVVFAAASLKEALDEAALQFQRANGQKVVVSYAASPALAKQIENRAPADVFISADLDWMDYIEQRKLVRAGSRVNLLRNRLVMIAPADSHVQVEIKPGFLLQKLLGDGKLSMADPDSVPAGKYGRAALEKLGVWRSVEGKIARADNVRAALNFVARGETPLGIVYQTDAYAEKKVRIAARFPADTHPAIIYPVAVIASSKHPAASSFVDYLKSADARAIFEKYGFSIDQ
ncbi:MAG TPA: molybdate ABC transporter substrate-binding protein [Burkholderiales bacterium]|jgi:molybdate transport system substrate-binding protein|nr:molybdate ABC transporter substrate-binding protein [Burkholderiales bacterium]